MAAAGRIDGCSAAAAALRAWLRRSDRSISPVASAAAGVARQGLPARKHRDVSTFPCCGLRASALQALVRRWDSSEVGNKDSKQCLYGYARTLQLKHDEGFVAPHHGSQGLQSMLADLVACSSMSAKWS